MEPNAKEWELNADFAIGTKFVKFNKAHPREYASLFNNLNKITGLLNGGQKIGGFHVGFFRSESDGLWRIGQSGVPHAKESRLYLFPDQDNRIFYLLSVGDKDSQQDDINEAKTLLKKIRDTRGSK